MRLALLCVVLLAARLASMPPAAGQVSGSAAPDALVLRTRLKKTIFSIDVLDLELRIQGDPAGRVRTWLDGDGLGHSERDSIVAAIVDARHVEALQTFVRSVSLGRFLGGIRANLRRARAAGFINAEAEARISAGLSRSYAFLADEGVHKGDRMLYSIHQDSLRIRYVDREGRLRLDQVDVGAQHRRALLGSYLAPHSDFRKGLLRSLRRDD